MDEYIRLSLLDTEKYFAGTVLEPLACVACHSKNTKSAFQKGGFNYENCQDCGSLYLSPRPSLESFVRFYSESESSHYWAHEFFPAVAEKRRELIFKPRATRVAQMMKSRGITPKRVTEVGAGFAIFLEELKPHVSSDCELIAIEPGQELAEVCREKGFETIALPVEEVKNAPLSDLVCCFEVIEHVHDPIQFLKSLFELVRPGGLLITTGLGVDGFDIQTLWQNSKSISPPHHINFASVKGFEKLYARAGFSEISVETPGKLDVDIVLNYYKDKKEAPPAFLSLLKERGPEALQAFQDFLVSQRMSSHTWISALRPETEPI